MLVVAGLSLKNLEPRVWDPSSPYYVSAVQAVMVSYADLHRMPSRRRNAMKQGLHEFLGAPETVKIYLDNGAFYFLGHDGGTPTHEYDEFVAEAGPDWWPIPRDYIPTPTMADEEKQECFARTMELNRAYNHDGYTPVVHVGPFLREYTAAIISDQVLSAKAGVAVGAMVPNLLRSPKAAPYPDILSALRQTRTSFVGKQIHVFGIGGTATLHLAILLGMDSADSSGWRNRAARGIVQMPGSGDRVVANLGNWRGREPSEGEWTQLENCQCPTCLLNGLVGLKASGLAGFCNRATHNLWVLLKEADWVENQIAKGTYEESFKKHLVNSVYVRLVDQVVRASTQACI